MSFDESMRQALEAAAAATKSNDNVDKGDLDRLTRSAAFFETVALLCRQAPPSEVFRAAEGSNEEDDDEEEEDEEFPRPQRTLLAALAAAAALLLLRSDGGRGSSGSGSKSSKYESRVLQEFARRSDVVADQLAEALASSLVEEGGREVQEEEHERDSRRPQLQAFFFGFDDLLPGEKKPTLSNTKSFPVVASTARDMLSGGTGKALWPASRALAASLLSRRFELISLVGREKSRRTKVVELGAGVGLVGAALSVGEGWWRRRRREEGEEEGGGREDDGSDIDENENSPSPFSLWLTDGDADAVSNSRRTLEANGIRIEELEESRIRVSQLDWREIEAERGAAAEGEEEIEKDQVLVVGSDITYDPQSAPFLAECLRSFLRDGGGRRSSSRAVLAGVVRSDETAMAFERAFAEQGLAFSCGPSPRVSFFDGEEDTKKKEGVSGRRVRAWHAGDEGVELRWWSVKEERVK